MNKKPFVIKPKRFSQHEKELEAFLRNPPPIPAITEMRRRMKERQEQQADEPTIVEGEP